MKFSPRDSTGSLTKRGHKRKLSERTGFSRFLRVTTRGLETKEDEEEEEDSRALQGMGLVIMTTPLEDDVDDDDTGGLVDCLMAMNTADSLSPPVLKRKCTLGTP
jgi:hypothetical protein